MRRAINVHPPYRIGWGDALMDFRIALPKQKPIRLDFATAIRDSDAKREGVSDGVDFRVLVNDGGGFKQLFARFSAAKRWEPARVDLSDYAGREVTLRLFTGPGPAHNTSCDSSFWAEPTLWVGAPVPAEPGDRRLARRQAAVRAARAALSGDTLERSGHGWRRSRARAEWTGGRLHRVRGRQARAGLRRFHVRD